MTLDRHIVHYERPGGIAWTTETAEQPAFHWLPLLLAFLRRRWLAMGAVFLASLVAASAYLLLATPNYTAKAAVLIDSRQSPALRQQAPGTDPHAENAFVESQAEILASAGVAQAVARALRLHEDPEFAPPTGTGLRSRILGWARATLGLPKETGAARDPVVIAAERLMRATRVRRIGLTYLVEVSVRTRSAERSAELANAIAQAYIDTQLAALYDVLRRAGGWMEDRVLELRERATAADRAVQEYRARNNLIATERGPLYEQQLSELSSHLIRALGDRAQAEAVAERAAALRRRGGTPAELADVLGSQTIARLREREVEASRRAAETLSRFGPNHPEARSASSELGAVRRQIEDEARRVLASLETTVEAARAREAALRRQVDDLVALSTVRSADAVALRGLESSADTYRRIYDSFFARYTQATQEQSFPIPDARIVTTATPPTRRSNPDTLFTLAGGAALGIALGFAAALTREAMDRGLRTASQLRAGVGLDCIALVPRLPRRRRGARRAPPPPSQGGGLPAVPGVEPRGVGVVATPPPALRHVVSDPMSRFSEAMRTVALRVAHQRLRAKGTKVIGCVGATPGSGTSTVAANLAQCLAQAGHRTALLDWDLRGHSACSLSHALVPDAPLGFVEAVERKVPIADVMWLDPMTGLRFMPAAARRPTRHPAEILDSPRAGAFMAGLRAEHDFIVVDLPPLDATTDAQAAQGLVDSFIVVVEWGEVPPGALVEMLTRFGIVETPILGAVLNKVDLDRLRRYDPGTRPMPVQPVAA